MKKLAYLVIILPLSVWAQKVENLRAETQADRIVITYDITGAEATDNFRVSLFASHNNYVQALARVTGDVGSNVRAGKGKHIEWDSKTELGNYKGTLTFELEVIVIAPLSFRTDISAAKRGKQAQLTWRGGDPNQKVSIELLKGGQSVDVITTTSNQGAYNWNIPKNTKTGKDYQMKLTNGKEAATTANFSIKPKISPLIKYGVPIAIGTAVVLFTSGSNGGGGESSNKLIGPPNILD